MQTLWAKNVIPTSIPNIHAYNIGVDKAQIWKQYYQAEENGF